MNEGKKKSLLAYIGPAIIVLLVAAMVGMAVCAAVMCIQDLEHYNRVHQNPLEVVATITRHAKYEDEEGTDYVSYVSYSVNGVSYDVWYEEKDKESQLTAVGTQVVVQVSPEDPGRAIEKLRNGSFGILLAAVILSILGAVGLSRLVKGKRSKKNTGIPDMETVERDLRRTILGRMSLVLWLLLCVAGLTIRWRYPAVFGQWLTWTAAGCGVLFLWCFVRAIRDYHTVRNQRYRMHRDTLESKEIKSGEDSDTYWLTFRGEDGNQWRTTTTERNYRSMSEGTTVIAVYLPGKQKPILHYNALGEAE